MPLVSPELVLNTWCAIYDSRDANMTRSQVLSRTISSNEPLFRFFGTIIRHQITPPSPYLPSHPPWYFLVKNTKIQRNVLLRNVAVGGKTAENPQYHNN